MQGQSVLLRVKWLRVILDEAHHIRNTNTHRSNAIAQLHAHRKWALTGMQGAGRWEVSS